MKKKIIVGNSVVKNEEFWFGYGMASVINYFDHLFITDTGSLDNTKQIIQYFIDKYPNKITLIEKYPKTDDEFTISFPEYKNELVQLARNYKADFICCLDGDEIYYESKIITIINKLQTLNNRWKMIAVNTRYFVNNLYYILNKDTNIWHYRFFDLSQGEWSLNYGDILWTNPAVPKNQRLTLEIIPNQIDMLHLSLLMRSVHDNKTTARIRRQTLRRPGGKNVGEPSIHNFSFPEVLYDPELYELTQNPYVKDLLSK